MIIEVRSNREKSCLICCKYGEETHDISINKPNRVNNIFAFSVCDDCLQQMGRDMEEIMKEMRKW